MKKAITSNDLFLLAIVIFAGLLLFKITFSTAIYGDEWKVFWLGHSAKHIQGNILNQSTGDLPYIFEIVILNIFHKYFDYNSTYYYIFSFLTRTTAAITFYFLLKSFKFNPFSSLVGSMLFMITPTGIEATDWMRNFDSYIGISLFLIIINRLFSPDRKKAVFYISLIFLVLLLINTTRTPGIFITTIILTIFGLFHTNKNKLSYLLLIFFLTASYLLVSKTNLFGVQAPNILNEFSLNPFIKSFFGNLGNTMLPDKTNRALTFGTIWFVIILWKKGLFFGKGLIFKKELIINVFALFTVFYLVAQISDPFNESVVYGIYFFTVFLLLIVLELIKKDFKDLKITLLSSLLGSSFILIPLIRIPQIHAETEHRYLIYSALAMPLIFASATNVLTKTKNNAAFKTVFSLSLIIITFSLFKQSTNYLRLQNWAHNERYARIIWKQLNENIESSETEKDFSVIILTDSETYPRANSTFYFGSNYHLGIIYKIWEEKRLPLTWISIGEKLDEAQVPPEVISKGRNIIVFRIAGEKVERINPKAKP